MHILEIADWGKILLPYEQAVDELLIKFERLKKEFERENKHSPIEIVAGRVKGVGSILEKANRKNIPYDRIEEEIEDIAGIRIICRFVEDIDRVIQLIRRRDGKDIFISEERDYINNRKKSGYRSYHILVRYPIIMSKGKRNVKAEIQIRTMAMNFWATIEHSIKYKYSGNVPDDLQAKLQALAETAYNMDMEMGTVRGEIMDAIRIIEVKNKLVDKIRDKIERLHRDAGFEQLDEITKKFYDVYALNDNKQLIEFDEELAIIASLYKV
ncbi:MAG: GTP pyrophosphokinase family protein [Clostridiales bacterium]|nr:GTP pyrophosphokinase family protein [Clostridiales bacterium]